MTRLVEKLCDWQPLRRKSRRRDIASPTKLQIYEQTAHSVALMCMTAFKKVTLMKVLGPFLTEIYSIDLFKSNKIN